MKWGLNVPGFIYIVEAENGLFKIGFSGHPRLRAQGILSNSPTKVRLVAYFPGIGVDERNLHKRFAKMRAWNEWFNPVGEILSFVEANRGRGGVVIKEWSEIGRPEGRAKNGR